MPGSVRIEYNVILSEEALALQCVYANQKRDAVTCDLRGARKRSLANRDDCGRVVNQTAKFLFRTAEGSLPFGRVAGLVFAPGWFRSNRRAMLRMLLDPAPRGVRFSEMLRNARRHFSSALCQFWLIRIPKDADLGLEFSNEVDFVGVFHDPGRVNSQAGK